MLNSFVSRKTFMVHSQNGKKSISKDIFCSLSMKVDNNNKHRCQQCRQKPEHFPKVRITYRYTHSYKVPAQHLLLLQVVATKTLKIQVPYKILSNITLILSSMFRYLLMCQSVTGKSYHSGVTVSSKFQSYLQLNLKVINDSSNNRELNGKKTVTEHKLHCLITLLSFKFYSSYANRGFRKTTEHKIQQQ